MAVHLVKAAGLAVALVAVLVSSLAAQSPDQAVAEAARYRESGDAAAALAILDAALAEFPREPLLHFNRGLALSEYKRYEEAAQGLRRGLALAPEHAQARLALAKVLVSSHRYADALAEVDRYAERAGVAAQGFGGHYVRGLALRHLDRPEEAAAELRSAVEMNPGHADALFNLGAVLAKMGADHEAAALLAKAAGLQPENPDIRYRLSGVLRRTGDVVGAERHIAAFRELRDRMQRDSRLAVLMQQAERSMALGKPGKAKELYQQAIRRDASNARAHANLGVAYEQLGRGDLAELMFRKALDLNPEYADAHLNLGLKQAAKGALEDARVMISEALRINPDLVAARQGLAMVLTRLNRPLAAVPHFEAIVELNGQSVDAHLNLGIALAEGGQTAEALESFREAVRIAPESNRPHYNVGRALNDLGRPMEAREALQRAISLNDGYAPALQLLGTLERAAGNDEQAVGYLRRSATADPGNPLAHYDLGLAIKQAGDPQAAVPHFERTLELNPRHMESIYNLAQALHALDPERAAEYRRRFKALKAEELDTDRAGTLWNFALAEAKRERWTEAFELFRKALDACGDCPAKGQIHKNFGLTYGHAGDYANAASELAKALELLPDDPEIKQALVVVRESGGSQR